MILGQSAGTTACLALDADLAVQDVPYETLSKRLIEDGQVLATPASSASSGGSRGVAPASLEGVVVDDLAATLEGDWLSSTGQGRWVGYGYRHDANEGQGEKSIRFETELEEPGKYEVRLAYSTSSNRATNAVVRIEHAGGVEELTVDQLVVPPIDDLFVSLGTFEFEGTAAVTVSNQDADGYVIADAVQWISVQ